MKKQCPYFNPKSRMVSSQNHTDDLEKSDAGVTVNSTSFVHGTHEILLFTDMEVDIN